MGLWRGSVVAVAALAPAALLACGGSRTQSASGACTSGGACAPPQKTVQPPATLGHYTFYSTDQGLSPTVNDVSADEGGNVYVAAGDAVYAKPPGARDFLRFGPDDAGLTKNCHDPSEISVANPASPASTCPIISVAGTTPGKAVIGFQGVGTDSDADATWALWSGGADALSFDGKKLSRDRHVFIATPPHHMCEQWLDAAHTQCAPYDFTWVNGRTKMRQIFRVVANHDKSRAMSYGDVLFSGTHGSIAVLAAHPDQRQMMDFTGGDPKWADAKWVWEHSHPALDWPDGRFLTGETWALAVDPTTNVPWFANQFRLASQPGIATTSAPTWNDWWGDMVPAYPYIAIWQPQSSPDDASLRDNASALSFCDDGTLWVASSTNGLARRAPDGSTTLVSLPAGTGNSALAVACDPSDGSVWVGFGWGGFGHLANGAWTVLPPDAPAFAVRNPVRSIQIDRWSSPRVVWIATIASQRFGAGGVTSYDGP